MPKVVPEYKEKAIRRILDAANEEFMRKGYRNTTMSDIAERVGVSKAAVYQYFESKEELVGAVASALVWKFVARESSVARAGTVGETTSLALERVLDSMPNWFPQLLCDYLAKAHHDKEAGRKVREIDEKIVEAISALWDEGKKAGKVPQNLNTEGIARGMEALCLGLLALVSIGLPRSQAIEAWKETVKTMGRGLEPKRVRGNKR